MIKRFYFPLTVTIYERDNNGWWTDDYFEGDGWYADDYRSEIESRLDDYIYDNMVEYFDESETAREKIRSMIWGFESVNECLYGKVYLTLSEELTEEEIGAVKEYICGQNSDGLGEGFEQQGIRIGHDKEIYVSFWHHGDDYWIYDENEFNTNVRNNK